MIYVQSLRAPLAADDEHDALLHVQRQLQAWAVLADCEATLSRVALEPGWQEGEHAPLTMRAQTVLAQGREIMLAGDALGNALSAHGGSSSPETVDAARTALERAAAELDRYADGLASDPPAADCPPRATIAGPAATPVDGPIIAAADELSRQVAGCRTGASKHSTRPCRNRRYEHETLASIVAILRVDLVRAGGLRADPS